MRENKQVFWERVVDLFQWLVLHNYILPIFNTVWSRFK